MKYFFGFTWFLILLLYSTILSSQDVIVKYDSYNRTSPDITDSRFKNMPEQLKAKVIKNSMIKYKDEFTLKYSNGKSSYVYNKRVFESEPDFKSIGFLLDFFNDYKSEKIICVAKWIPKDFQVVRNFDEIKKQLFDDTLTINDFLCKKAEVEFLKGRKATIWYTLEIPIEAGPSWFFGLPGLVIRVEINDYVTEAVEIEFPQNPVKIEIPNRKNTITYEEYKKRKVIEWISEYDN